MKRDALSALGLASHVAARLADRSRARQVREALEAGQLDVHYQPKIELRSQRVSGVEALVRWRHPTRGLLAPAAFLPTDEHDGPMVELTAHVLDVAIGQAAEWRRRGVSLSVAVNISAASVADERLAGTIDALLRRFDVPARQLVLEITETAVLRDPERCAELLHEIAGAGVSISLDDFGTGQSSLSRLLRLPIHELKLDREFVRAMSVGHDKDRLVHAILTFAHDLGHRVVAEGVEDRAMLDRLADLGCDEAQGYYICRPLPADELPDWVLRPRGAADRLFSRPLGGGAWEKPFRAPAVAWR